MSGAQDGAAPSAASVEAWCRAYVEADTPAAKLGPPPRPRIFGGGALAAPPAAPGRAAGFRVARRAERTPSASALRGAPARARLLHTFLHHEVQAAELMAWAVLRFPDAPRRFRTGLLGVLDDEVRHARAYARRLADLDVEYGELPVRDWFWSRVPACAEPREFVALMGMGLEGGNLEHTRRFEGLLRAADDPRSADLVAEVGREEVRHVRFATRWFARWTEGDPDADPDFDRWRAALPPPLTPTVLRGRPLDRERRSRAGQRGVFLERLEAWDGDPACDGASSS